MMPMPDPPPQSDPFWARRAEDERWFAIGCCSTPVFAFSGLVLLVVSFVSRGPPSADPPAG